MSYRTALRVLAGAAAIAALFVACTDESEPNSAADETPAQQDTPSAAASSPDFGDGILTEVEAENGKFLRVHFIVSAEDNSELFDALQGCTEENIDDYNRVECYAYSSEEAFRAASVDPDNGEVGKQCWVAHLGQDRSGEGVGKLTNEDYEEEGCPA